MAADANGFDYGDDIFTEPDADTDTLANLGPLTAMAGSWVGSSGADTHLAAEGLVRDAFTEQFELQPIDPQTNGPQLLYGLRYHTRVVKVGEVETFHDQVGYWLWEPATKTVTLTIAIPRGQVLLAGGTAEPDATEFEVRAAVESETYGILSSPFLDQNFRTLSFGMHVTIHADGTWSYEEEVMLDIAGHDEPFSHVDGNTLSRVAPPILNPLAAQDS